MSKKADPKANDSFFHPSKEVVKQARIKDYDKLYAESIRDRESFWAKEAKSLSWYDKTMWIIELTIKTKTAESRIGSHNAVTETI